LVLSLGLRCLIIKDSFIKASMSVVPDDIRSDKNKLC